MPTSPILPTIHSNGTSRGMLKEGYDTAADKLREFLDAWGAIEFNARDYYPQGPLAWNTAVEEREAMNYNLRVVRDHIQAVREHLYNE